MKLHDTISTGNQSPGTLSFEQRVLLAQALVMLSRPLGDNHLNVAYSVASSQPPLRAEGPFESSDQASETQPERER